MVPRFLELWSEEAHNDFKEIFLRAILLEKMLYHT